MDVVYIDSQIIDLDPKNSIAWTIQRVDIGELSKNYISFSNTIKAADTEKNNRVFQNAKLENSDGTFQYGFQDCKVVQNGVESIIGKAQITGFDGSFYTIVIYDSFVSLVSLLEGKTLKDIYYGNISWLPAGIDAARLNTSTFISAVMNWGRDAIYEANYFLPCYFYKDLITKIFQLGGYTPSGQILTNTDFTELVCAPFERFKYNNDFSKITKPTADLIELSVSASGSFKPTFDTGDITPYTGNGIITAELVIEWTKDPSSTSNIVVRLVGRTSGTIFGSGAPITGNISTNQVYEFTDITPVLAETLEIELVYTKDASYPSDLVDIQVLQGDTSINFDCSTVNRGNPRWSELTGDKSLPSVLKDFFVRFGIIYKIDGNIVNLKTIEEICTDTASAVDWSSKRVNRKKSLIDFKTTYAQSNYLLHEDNVKDKFLGSGNLAIANTTLQAAKDFFTSAFTHAKRWTGIGYEVMSSPVYESASTGIDDVKNEAPLMIGTLKARTTEAAITFNATARTDYKLAYHADASQTKDTSFRYFLSKYYPTLSLALQKNKVCKYEYYLNEMDITNYDPHKMIYDSGSYYLINKIDKFRSGKITTVELFKIQ
jgi:hypothetical protein